MEQEKFNQSKYIKEWTKENMTGISAKYKSDFVQEFKTALKLLDYKTSDIIRQAMQQVIKEAKDKGLM